MSDLNKLYVDWKYQEWIARLVKEAEVKFNDQAYKEVSMQEEVLEN